MSYMGWEAKVYKGNKVTDPASTGDGSTVNFTLDEKVITEDPARATAIEMVVTLDGVVQVLTTDYTFVPGTPDAITFVAAPASGEAILITYFKEVLVGNARTMSYDISRALIPVTGVGNYKPVVIKAGKAEFSGSIEHFFTNKEFWDAVDPALQFLPEFVIQAQVGSPTVAKKVNFIGVKFETLSGEHPQDDFAIESLDWQARDAKFSET